MESLENLIDYLISKKAPDIKNPVIIFESDKDNNLYPIRVNQSARRREIC